MNRKLRQLQCNYLTVSHAVIIGIKIMSPQDYDLLNDRGYILHILHLPYKDKSTFIFSEGIQLLAYVLHALNFRTEQV